MKKKYISPVIIQCHDIDISIIASTIDAGTGKVDDSGASVEAPETGGTGTTKPHFSKGNTWNLWEDEEENSFY